MWLTHNPFKKYKNTTCEHGLAQPLYPVAPHAEAEQRLEAIEGSDPDLGDEVGGEVKAGQQGLWHELVPEEKMGE